MPTYSHVNVYQPFSRTDPCRLLSRACPGANGTVLIGSLDGSLYCLAASTGALVWSTPTGYYIQGSPAVSLPGTPTGSNGTSPVVFVGSGDGHLYAIDAR
jgi:outer membrane protein assembly factor BamB